MSLKPEDVVKVADLARLELTQDEIKQYQSQLSSILEYVKVLDELTLDDVLPTSHAVAQENVWREDVTEPCLPIDEVLLNAPQQAKNQFLIQAVLAAGN